MAGDCSVAGAGALITPALFSHRTPPFREKREWLVRMSLKMSSSLFFRLPLSPTGRVEGWERGLGSEGWHAFVTPG
jgi:hypothetical protein